MTRARHGRSDSTSYLGMAVTSNYPQPLIMHKFRVPFCGPSGASFFRCAACRVCHSPNLRYWVRDSLVNCYHVRIVQRFHFGTCLIFVPLVPGLARNPCIVRKTLAN